MPFKSIYDRPALSERFMRSNRAKAVEDAAAEAVQRAKRIGGDAGVRALARAAARHTMRAISHGHSDSHQPSADAAG